MDDAETEGSVSDAGAGEELCAASDLRGGPRDIVVVTTAALPWMTGTAVNPLLRVMYLARDGHRVTLCVPWLADAAHQRGVFPAGVVFSSREEQAEGIMAYARAELPGVQFEIAWYDGVYAAEFGSILPLGDVTRALEGGACDVCVLEEPEHLTWHHTGGSWTRMFRIVVGVIHTNYIAYVQDQGLFGPQRAVCMAFLNSWVCRSYCHRVIKLSDALQPFPHSVTCNVHGVRDKYLRIGTARGGAPFPRGAYFMGKCLWSKGYRALLDLLEDHYYRHGATPDHALPIDLFGAGPDAPAVAHAIRTSPALANVRFSARVADHTSPHLQGYQVYVNASNSDVVCTATAEALAMGKNAVLLHHPSNDFFAAFPNTRTYTTPEAFSAALAAALAAPPAPLSPRHAHLLSWPAATERFYDAVRIPPSRARARAVDAVLADTHTTLSKLVTAPGENVLARQARAPAHRE